MKDRGYFNGLRRLGEKLGLLHFRDWWLGELAGMIPRKLIGAARNAMEQRVLVATNGLRVTFSRIVDGSLVEAASLDMGAHGAAEQRLAFMREMKQISPQTAEVALCLPSHLVLCKKITLPPATEENLRQVLAFEMDRLTPFKAEQVYFDYRFAHRDKQLDVSLAVTPKAALDEQLKQLSAWGAEVTAVLVTSNVPDGISWNLLPAGQRQMGKAARLSRFTFALASGLVILLCVAVALPIWKKREALLALNPLLHKAHQQAEKAEDLRRQFETLLAEYNYLLTKKRETPPVVAILDEVTRVLPNDTWVQHLDLKGTELQIQGETASSSKLVALFEQSKILHGANFRAPLTKGMGENSERFQLAAETRPLPSLETEPRVSLLPTQSVAAAPGKAP